MMDFSLPAPRARLLVILLLVLLMAACSTPEPERGPLQEPPQESEQLPPPDADPPSGITGTVVDEEGQPVVGARVEAVPADAEPGAEGNAATYVRVGTTGADGVFMIDVKTPGQYRIVVHAGSQGAGSVSIEVKADAQGRIAVKVSLTVRSTGSIAGWVELEGSADALGASIFIPGTTFSARSDASGQFLLDGVPEGSWPVVFEHEGFARVQQTVNVRAGRTTTVDTVVLTPVEPLLITDFSATPMSGPAPLDVTFTWDAQGPATESLTCRLDADGDGIIEHESSCSAGSFTNTFTEAGTYRAELLVVTASQRTTASLQLRVDPEVADGSDGDGDGDGDGGDGDGDGNGGVDGGDGDGDGGTDEPFVRRQRLGVTENIARTNLHRRMAASDDFVLIGVPSLLEGGGPGQVEVYGRADDGSWSFTGTLPAPVEALQHFGEQIVISGSTAAVAGDGRVGGSTESEAMVWVYEHEGSTGGWRLQHRFLQGERIPVWNVAIDLAGDILAIGVTDPDGNPSPGSREASVRIFDRNFGGADTWTETPSIPWQEREDEHGGIFFGSDVDISSNGLTIAVSDVDQDDDNGLLVPNVFVFERTSVTGPWRMARRLSHTELPSYYSALVEVDGDTLAVMPMAMRDARADVMIFGRNARGTVPWGRTTNFVIDPTLEAGASPQYVFLSAGLAGGTLAVGVGPAGCISQAPVTHCVGGRVYLFGETPEGSGTWSTVGLLEEQLPAESTLSSSRYGEYVGLSDSGKTVVVGGTAWEPNGRNYAYADVFELE